jgi:hypothetical protein
MPEAASAGDSESFGAPGTATGDSERARGAFEPPAQQHPELAGLLHIDYDLLAGDGVDSLSRLKDLYETAEAIGGEGLDKHFDELLERQQRLIGAYFDEYRTDLAARAAR